ncbi:SCO2400 family protein, partial [Streptomyces eurythermus]|uniref:SCO2400 family protein n=1 Tax=Streptomyces eurythermus TaxID=42237 RepID=UPI003F4CE87E
MDYCHPCRRHLNGALACPGCGTPAPRRRTFSRGTRQPGEGRLLGHWNRRAEEQG